MIPFLFPVSVVSHPEETRSERRVLVVKTSDRIGKNEKGEKREKKKEATGVVSFIKKKRVEKGISNYTKIQHRVYVL